MESIGPTQEEDAEWLAWHEVDDQLNLMLIRHGVPLRDVDMTAFRQALEEYRQAVLASPSSGEKPGEAM